MCWPSIDKVDVRTVTVLPRGTTGGPAMNVTATPTKSKTNDAMMSSSDRCGTAAAELTVAEVMAAAIDAAAGTTFGVHRWAARPVSSPSDVTTADSTTADSSASEPSMTADAPSPISESVGLSTIRSTASPSVPDASCALFLSSTSVSSLMCVPPPTPSDPSSSSNSAPLSNSAPSSNSSSLPNSAPSSNSSSVSKSLPKSSSRPESSSVSSLASVSLSDAFSDASGAAASCEPPGRVRSPSEEVVDESDEESAPVSALATSAPTIIAAETPAATTPAPIHVEICDTLPPRTTEFDKRQASAF